MARSTGPILATAAITVVNRSVLNDKDIDWRIILGTGVAAVGLALLEKASEGFAVGLAWLTLVTTLFVKVDPTVPPPAESLLRVVKF